MDRQGDGRQAMSYHNNSSLLPVGLNHKFSFINPEKERRVNKFRREREYYKDISENTKKKPTTYE